MLNKKAQVGETITWIVATIVIIVILAISIFIASVSAKRDKGYLELEDKQKDFIATKSIVNFLIENFDLVKSSVESRNYELLGKEFAPFLGGLVISGMENKANWNLELFVDGKLEFSPFIPGGVFEPGWRNYYDIYFNLGPRIKLRFWEECQSLC